MERASTPSENGGLVAPSAGQTTTREDNGLVELVRAVLVDPNVHTDMRMHLSHEIPQLLRKAHEDVYGPVTGPARYEAVERSVAADDDRVARLVMAVLVDPNVHTDMRMRLQDKIPRLVSQAREHTRER